MPRSSNATRARALGEPVLTGGQAGERAAFEQLVPVPLWAPALEDFSRRNAARAARLEIDDAAFGAQIEERGQPLAGVAYDRHDDRVTIMLGDLAAPGRHLTHVIPHARELQILTGVDGRDRVLRIGYADGQALLVLQ